MFAVGLHEYSCPHILKGVYQLDAGSLVGVLAVCALVATNGFFVAAEFGLVKVRQTRIDELAAQGNSVAKVVQDEVKHLDSYIAATQLGITLASLALGWIGEPSLAHLIEPLFAFAWDATAIAPAHSVAVTISFFLIMMFHIVLGELVPKSIALQRSEGTALFVARPLYLFARLFRPFIVLMNGFGNLVVRALSMQATSEYASVHTVKELEMLVAQSHKAQYCSNKKNDKIQKLIHRIERRHSRLVARLALVLSVELFEHALVGTQVTFWQQLSCQPRVHLLPQGFLVRTLYLG